MLAVAAAELRSFVTVGEDTQLGHSLTVERAARIGDGVRCSPGSHITSNCVLADRVFLYVGSTSRTRPSSSWNNAPAAIRFRASEAMYSSSGRSGETPEVIP